VGRDPPDVILINSAYINSDYVQSTIISEFFLVHIEIIHFFEGVGVTDVWVADARKK